MTARCHFHRMPNEEQIRKQWIAKIRRDVGPYFKVSGFFWKNIIPLIDFLFVFHSFYLHGYNVLTPTLL